MQSAKVTQYTVPNLYTITVHTYFFFTKHKMYSFYTRVKVEKLCERADPTDSGCDPEAWRSGCERSQP